MKYLKYLFSCKHPAYWLRWNRGVTPLIGPIYADFEDHLMHCHCDKCGKDVTLTFARLVGGVDAFFARGRIADHEEQKP